MKKEILVKALRGIRYAGEIIVLADMAIHICKFTKEHIIPRLCKNKNEVADVPVVDLNEAIIIAAETILALCRAIKKGVALAEKIKKARPP